MTKKFDFDEIIDRRGTSSEKWDKYRDRDIIPLWVADMDFRSPPAVIEALHERVSHGVFGYTAPSESLVEAVLKSLGDEFGWQVAKEWIVWLPGLVTGLNVACRSVGAAGDDVITFTPVYPPFMSAPPLSGRNAINVPLVCEKGRWGFNLEDLERAVTPATRLLLLCSPHNPVGRVWSREELELLAQFAQRHDLIICSDEIHAGLVLEEGVRHIPIATLSPETGARTITLFAPSKTYNVPGLGCSFAVISDDALRRAFKKAMGRIVPHVNLLGYTAAEAAYRYGEEWRQELIAYLRGNRDLVAREVARMPGLEVAPVEATYLSWIDVRETGIEDPVRFFEEAGVGLSGGNDFGLPGYVRLNFGCRRELLAEALRRMRVALETRAGI
ncbi:Cystathionine beta-lyase, type II [Citrifermentans bremense]|uniref:cysteine-S-conjugate beta-lyase n=1 Tax=Citrifermentans bremense TaxID=60035 RepID=A0A6S6M136_9BACT|nr:PatB family C-S lyase [Citrifermentans bremense]BCG45304.1 Cystathionine beta-lyase, type II [Citrifermentans bremense]